VDHLPPNLCILKFGFYFSQAVDNISPSLHILTFGVFFNQKVDNLPPNLRILKFGYFFNQLMKNLVPSLIHLEFGENYDTSFLDHIFPSSMLTVKVGQKIINIASVDFDFLFEILFKSCIYK
jgi:hypothetical protein